MKHFLVYKGNSNKWQLTVAPILSMAKNKVRLLIQYSN